MESSEIKVSRVQREVIEGKLLAALDDSSKVAILCSEDDLELLIYVLEKLPLPSMPVRQMAKDLRRLRAEAFQDVERM